MLVSIIGKDMFKVGERIMKVGEEIDLSLVPDVSVPDIGTIPAEQLRAKLVALNTWIRDTKQWMLNTLNQVEEVYNERLAVTCWEYVNAYRDWAFYVDILFKAVEKHLGGGPPLQIDPENGKITIRALKADPREAMGENLNWTRDMIDRQVQFHRYEGVRGIILKAKPEARGHMGFDVKLLAKLGLPCVTVPSGLISEIVDMKTLAKAAVDVFTDLQGQVPICLIWEVDGTYYFIDMKERVLPNQTGRPPTPLAALLPEINSKLGKPTSIGLVLFGDLGHIVKGKRGLVASRISEANEESHYAMSMEGEAFAELSTGCGLKLEESLTKAIVQLMTEEKK